MLGRSRPDEYPDLSDALLYLDREGLAVCIEDSLGLPWNPLSRLDEFYSGFDPLRAARVAFRRPRYDAVVCVGDASAYALARFRELWGGVPPILVIDPALATDYPRRRRVQDYLLPRVDRVVVFGRSQVEALSERYGARVAVDFIHHRVDCDFYTPAPSPGRSDGPLTVFSIGNDRSRDFATLAAAVDRLPATASRFVVRTQLPVPQTDRLTVLRDFASYPALREEYRQADVVVIPLRNGVHAGGINSLLEAMASGCAVVVSGARGVSDYVTDGESGIVVERGKPDVLADAVMSLLSSEGRRLELGRRARAFVMEHCDNRVYATRLASIIRDVVERRRVAGRQPA